MRRATIMGLAVVLAGAGLAFVILGRDRPDDARESQPAASATSPGDSSKSAGERREDYFASRRPVIAAQPLPPPGTKLAEIYPGLKVLADAGDTRAACRLAYELNRCRNLGRLKWVAENSAAGLVTATTAGPEIDASVGARQQEYEQAARVCADFPQEETSKAAMYDRGAACDPPQ